MIKRIFRFIFSSPMTVFLLSLLAIVLAVATFIEEKFDTQTAKLWVYQAKWFELIFVLLILNLFGHIQQYNLLSRKKWAGLLFHSSFIIIILGAGITRYFGFEGSMPIREGETSNIMYLSEPYLQVSIDEKGNKNEVSKPFTISKFAKNSFHAELLTESKGKIELDYNSIILNAVQRIKENQTGGKNILEMIVASQNGQQNLLIEDGTNMTGSNIAIGFNNTDAGNTISVTEQDGVLNFVSASAVVIGDMEMKPEDTIPANTLTELLGEKVYAVQGSIFHLNYLYKNAKMQWEAGKPDEKGTDILVLDVTINGKKEQANVFGGSGYIMNLQNFTFDGLNVQIGYGEKPLELPFSIKLRDFTLDRYAGSMSPSSYSSEVTLIDNRYNLKEDHKIFMNNVLDYNKFRFFQSSYDADEKGTILSVNHDYYGTKITYFGYLLMIIGFILTLFNKHSRFYMLARKIAEIKQLRKTGTLIAFFVFGLFSFSLAQETPQKPVSIDHADKFGHLLSQTFDGRFEPVHSLAYDVMHKISRKDEFDLAGKGKMNAMQVLIDMLISPDFWKEQEIIYVKEKSVQDIIGISTKYAKFLDFFDENQQYKLQKYVDEAFRKKQSEQNSFDKEIIKVDERMNIFVMAIKGSMLKIFPDQLDKNNKWVSVDDKESMQPLSGAIQIINEDLQLQQFNCRNIMIAYVTEVQTGIASGDYGKADKIIGYMASIQRNSASPGLLASESKINVEILYNKLQIFIVLRNFYSILSVVLLLLAFIENLQVIKNKFVTWSLNISIGLLAVGFLYHTVGLIMRWYLTGHAPWSNGYESLLLVAWGGLLAGFSFVRYSKITLAATALLAFFMLMTASHSSYDPQLTNLQPVLKSYWLIVHVATLTISYGFLGLGFFLGLINLFIIMFKNTKNRTKLDLILAELTYINEMNLTVGIVLATIGTFLGGVWANESWGRYWGWDAKETWALVIVLAYTLVLHLRFIPKMKSVYAFNVASVLGFASVIMTFVGVNYYLSKGLHSYGAGDTPVFPLWAWGIILSVIALIIGAGIKQNLTKVDLTNNNPDQNESVI
ncbi:MAG: cytochrome c biogenesis protein CcsA [Bacteroidales bacterium]